jgi:uncharacterized membrane protein YpjA
MTIEVDSLILNCGLSLVSALAGAYAGTRAATVWQTHMQQRSEAKQAEATLLKSILVCRHLAMMVDKVKKKTFVENIPKEWQEVNIIGIWLTNDVGHEIQTMLGAVSGDKWQLVEDAAHAEWVAKSVFSVAQQRDIEFTHLQKFILEKGAPGKMTKAQAVALIGDAWASKLDSLTKDLQNAILEAEKQNLDVHNKLAEILKSKRAKKSA